MSKPLIFKKEHGLVIILICFLFLYLSSSDRYIDKDQIFKSPLENLNYHFITNLHNKGTLEFKLPNYDIIFEGARNPLSAFMPRDGSILDNKIIPQDSGGIYIIAHVFINNILLVITPIVAIVTLAYLYLLAYEVTNLKRSAFYTVIISGSFPVFWYLSSRIIIPDIFSVSFLIMAFYYAYRSLSFPAIKTNLLLAILFLSISLIIRYTNVIYILPVALFLLFKHFKLFLDYRFVLSAIALALAPISSVLLLNNYFYGNFFNTGYSASYEVIGTSSNVNTSFLQINFDYVLIHLKKYLFLLAPIMTILFSISVFLIHDYKRKILLIYVLGLLFITSIYFGSRVVWGLGTDVPVIDSSFARYLLPLYLLMSIFIAYMLSYVKTGTAVLIVVLIFLTNINTTFINKSGIIYTKSYTKTAGIIRNEILDLTENNAVIFVTEADKYLFPERNTIVTGLFAAQQDQGTTRVWNLKPDARRLSATIISLATQNIPIYYFDEGVLKIDELNSSLGTSGYRFSKFKHKDNFYKLYKTSIDDI